MNLRKYRIFLSIPIVLSLILFTFPLSAEENEHILNSSLDAHLQVNFEGIGETWFYTPHHKFSFITKVIYQKPDFMYIEYLEPPQAKGEIIIDDGEKRFEYLPQKDEVKVLPSLNCPKIETRRKKALKIMLANFKISLLSQEKILGRTAYVLYLSPKNSISPSLKLWIDKETYLTLRREKYNPHGELVFFFRYIEAKFNRYFPRKELYDKIPKIPSIQKEPPLLPYYDQQEIADKAGFPIFFPKYLPSGYVFQRAELIKKESSVKLIYTNGLETIVLFQRPQIKIMMRRHRWMMFDNMRIRYKIGHYGSSLVWNRQGRTFILIGDLPLEELKKIVQSIK